MYAGKQPTLTSFIPEGLCWRHLGRIHVILFDNEGTYH